MYKERAISNPNPQRHNNKTRMKKNQRYKEIQKNEVISGDLPIELVLLTKNKSVYKVFNNNDYIFSYLEHMN